MFTTFLYEQELAYYNEKEGKTSMSFLLQKKNFNLSKKLFLGLFIIVLFLSPLSVSFNDISTTPYFPLTIEESVAHAVITLDDIKNFFGDAALNIGKGAIDATLGGIAYALTTTLFEAVSLLLAGAAYLLETSITTTLSQQVFNLPTVAEGWEIVRDLANMAFIFVLLYAAIATILQVQSFQTKQVLTRLVIVALLINFSFFFTRVLIDASNLLALYFHEGIRDTVQAESFPGHGGGPPGTPPGQSVPTNDLTVAFADALRLQVLYNIQDTNWLERAFTKDGPSNFDLAKIQVGATIIVFVAAIVFAVIALTFIVRTIALLILMIFSPFAFLGWILPGTQGYSRGWWRALFNYTLLAPISLIMLFIAVRIAIDGNLAMITGLASGEAASDAAAIDALNGGVDTFGYFLHVIIVIGLLIATLVVTRNAAGQAAQLSVKWGGAALATTTSFVGRRTLGKGGETLRDARWVKNLEGQGGWRGAVGRTLVGVGRGAEKATYDVTKAPGVGATLGAAGLRTGAGIGVKSREKAEKEALKRRERRAESLTTAEGKEAYAKKLQGRNLFTRLMTSAALGSSQSARTKAGENILESKEYKKAEFKALDKRFKNVSKADTQIILDQLGQLNSSIGKLTEAERRGIEEGEDLGAQKARQYHLEKYTEDYKRYNELKKSQKRKKDIEDMIRENIRDVTDEAGIGKEGGGGESKKSGGGGDEESA